MVGVFHLGLCNWLTLVIIRAGGRQDQLEARLRSAAGGKEEGIQELRPIIYRGMAQEAWPLGGLTNPRKCSEGINNPAFRSLETND